MSLIRTYAGVPMPSKIFDRPTETELAQLRAAAERARAAAGRAIEFMRERPFLILFSVVAFFSFGVSAFLFSLARVPSADASASVPAAAAAALPGAARPLELHIAQNGLTLLRSSKIVSIDGTTLTVSTAWGSAELIWKIRTNASQYETRDFGTKFLTRDGKKLSLSDFRRGDLVTITGTLDTSAEEPTVDAGAIRRSE